MSVGLKNGQVSVHTCVKDKMGLSVSLWENVHRTESKQSRLQNSTYAI